MNIVKDYNGKELTMTVEGRIDTITSQDLEKEINEEIGSFNSLIMNFEKVEYVSSAGLRLLISTQKKLKEENIPFAIKNVGDAVNEIFKMSGFDKIFNIEWKRLNNKFTIRKLVKSEYNEMKERYNEEE